MAMRVGLGRSMATSKSPRLSDRLDETVGIEDSVDFRVWFVPPVGEDMDGDVIMGEVALLVTAEDFSDEFCRKMEGIEGLR